MGRTLRWLCAVGLCATVSLAQGDPFEQLDLRVASLRPNGQCVVDRGTRDLVEVDDRVVLSPRNAPALNGRVIRVDERTSLVQLLNPTAVVPLGTRGHVLLPKARRQPVVEPPVEPQPGDPTAAEDPDAWQPGMPLLGRRRPPRPEERQSRMRGRVYGAGNLVRTLDSVSEHSFADVGVDVDINNVGGGGGTVRFHAEGNWSTEFSRNAGTDLRVYQLSYEHGGTRFDPWRWQAGRFLQRDMPEFGLLDGIEVGYRGRGGDRFGVSVGYLPVLDDDLESLADLQVAAWYLISDEAERVTFGLGYQKSWHRFEADRDLVVLKGRYLPLSGWDVSSSVFVDIYDGNDNLKAETVEVTRANVFVSRRWVREGGVEIFYDHEEYPDLLRNDNTQILTIRALLPQTIADAHVDRVSAHGWIHSDDDTRWFTRLTGWVDEQREGGAAELGVELAGVAGEGTRTVLAGFTVQGLTSSVLGGRIEHGRPFSFGRVDLLYELGFVHHEGFPDDSDDLFQHRLGALVSSDLGSGWDAVFFGDGTVWDDEVSFGVGIYLQRLF